MYMYRIGDIYELWPHTFHHYRAQRIPNVRCAAVVYIVLINVDPMDSDGPGAEEKAYIIYIMHGLLADADRINW
jgi:hypothetical protein